MSLPAVSAPDLYLPDTQSRLNGNPSGQRSGSSADVSLEVTDMIAMRVAVRQAERQARSARAAADEAGLQAIALRHEAERQMIAAEQARTQVGALANALYREGEVGALVEAVLTLGAPSQSSVLVGSSYVSVGSTSASALLRAQQQAEADAIRAADVATTALRGAEVLQGLALQQLSGLKALLRQAILNQQTRGPQTIVGADGCPIDAPDATLRGGAQELGVSELCRLSVARAPTPQAALAIKYALGQLGAPYACRGVGRLDPFRFDCSSFVARAYADGAGVPLTREGWAPSTRNMVPWDGIALDRHYALLPPGDLAPGDLVLYDTGGATYRHVVMVLADGYMVHTNACGDVLHVDRFWGIDGATKGQFLVARRVLLEPDYSLAPGDPATGAVPQPIPPLIPSDQEAGDTRA
ncbi:MAG: C40 family peptidase [Actinomycetales bacterium]